ncbi:MAG TPA: glucuronate isomerase [Candidatus Acidoferrum sp.]|jgi:glucuronate isomerase
MEFIHDDFLLHSDTARQLYHNYASREPILDYHSHLSPADIATDRRFSDLFEIWLQGDHYKWRAMRANGIHERFCTGDAVPYEKFLAWARTVPATLRNPLYHWTHLELKRYFGIGELLNEQSASAIWDRANAMLATPEFSVQNIIRKFHIVVLCSTDDPCDDLLPHQNLAAANPGFRLFPAFRPDQALSINVPAKFNSWVSRLAMASDTFISTFQHFLAALKKRHDYFHANGTRISDHGLARCPANWCTESEAAVVFDKARSGKVATPEDQERFASFLMMFFGRLDAERGWTKQLHLGALRNTNARLVSQLGPDTGFDSIGDWNQAAALCSYLDRLDQEGALPKTILYNVNPADNYVFATAIGNFQDGSIAGKVQWGSAWWFLDQKEGIELQLNALSNTGLLSRFIGMLTDSRSFMSFPRHEYFRRVLCDLMGRDVERGELPNDIPLIGGVVRNICFANAKQYLGLDLGTN